MDYCYWPQIFIFIFHSLVFTNLVEAVVLGNNNADFRCESVEDKFKMICHDVTSVSDVASIVPISTKSLVFINANFTVPSVPNLSQISGLEELTLQNSAVEWRKLNDNLSGMANIRHLTLDRVHNPSIKQHVKSGEEIKQLLEIPSHILKTLSSLQKITLKDCYVSGMADLNINNFQHLEKVTVIKGGFDCSNLNYDWMIDWSKDGRADISNLTDCFIKKDHHLTQGYSFNMKPFLIVIGYRKAMQVECPMGCHCELTAMKLSNLPMINVNCTEANFTSMPTSIPRYTTRINLTNNLITDMNPLFTNPNYSVIDEVILTHNQITHVDGNLLYQFAQRRSLDFSISLDYNCLATFPVNEVNQIYADGLRQDKTHLLWLHLAHNPWNCNNCSFMKPFQEFLRVHRNNIRDDEAVRCSEHTDKGSQRVHTIYIDDLCPPDQPLLTTLDYLNIALGILLIAFFANFAHNVYRYKTTGQLPWVVTGFTKVRC